jgi:NitT/TauT family transport system substrate-binding protein
MRGRGLCRRVPAAFLLLLGLVGAPAAASADDKVLFLLDWLPTGEHAAWFAGQGQGIFKNHGIDIAIQRGYGSGDTVAKVAGGVAPFGDADIGATMTARARNGSPVKSIMGVYTHSPHSLFVLKSSGITSFKGLEGKKISITPGNSHKLYFPKVAERAGTDPSKIEWVNTDASAMAGLLISKRIDASPFFAIHHYYQNKAAKRAGEEILVLPFVEVGFAIYSAGIVTTDEMIEKNPDLVKRFVAAMLESERWSNEHQEEACKLHVAKNPEVDLDDCQGSLKATMTYVFNEHADKVGLGKYEDARLQFTWENVAESQELDKSFDYRKAVDTRFVP